MHTTDSRMGILGIVPRPDCWERMLTHQQYYFPATYLTYLADATFLACYLSGWHPTQPHHISHTATICDYTVRQRRDIITTEPQHPRAHMAYVVLDIADLTPLVPALPSPRWHRVSIHRITADQLLRVPYLGHPAWRQIQRHANMGLDYV